MSFQLETPRLLLREMTPDDYPALCEIMQDDAVMYAYEGAFDEQETQAWLEEQLTRYEQLDVYKRQLWMKNASAEKRGSFSQQTCSTRES